jgi:uncharacterized protein (DUF1778 family)
MAASAIRDEKLSLRLSLEAKRALQSAAAHRSASEFVLESAPARAAGTHPDRAHFGLDAARWEAFRAALDAPPRALPCLSRLLEEPGAFGQQPRMTRAAAHQKLQRSHGV